MLSTMAEFFWHLAAMAVLLFFSAFFSGSETALFNLSHETRRRFRASRSPFQRLAARLIDDPRRVLVTVLFGNMAVNTAFFAMSIMLSHAVSHARPEHATYWSVAIVAAAPLVVIVFGEVMPKCVAAARPERLSILASAPLAALEYIVAPVRIVLGYGIVEPLERLITGGRRKEPPPMTADELQAIVEVAAREGVVSREESDMLTDVLELGELRVRDVMTPRVEIVGCDVATPTRLALLVFQRTGQTKIIVYEGGMDHVLGIVYAKAAFLNPDRPLAELVRPVYYVPETKAVESLLREFRARKIQFAVAVDEYGGVAGIVTLEDCLEPIVGDIQDEADRPAADPVQRLSDTEYRLAGNLSIRSWADLFNLEVPGDGRRYTTLAGFVASLLGRLPKPGDAVRWRNLEFTVEEVRHHRVMRVRLRLYGESGGEAVTADGIFPEGGPP